MQFRKKPVVIEATQWFKNGDHPQDDPTRGGTTPNSELWEGLVVRYFRHPNVPGQIPCGKCGQSMHDHGWIDTLEGGHIVCPGDWIITGVQGEHYPCKPDIFAKTYDHVEASPASVPEGQKPVASVFADEDCTKFIAKNMSHLRPMAKWWDLYIVPQATDPTPPVPDNRWLPIETAPKDGSHILGAQRFEEGNWLFEEIWYSTTWGFGGGNFLEAPTHWMPLPKAPAMQEGKL